MTGEELTNRIKGKGYTILSAAKALGISRQTLHTHLGKANLDPELLHNVKTILKVDVEEGIHTGGYPADLMQTVHEQLTALKATIKILTLKIVKLESKATKKPFDKVSLELEEMIGKEYDRLLGEIRRES